MKPIFASLLVVGIATLSSCSKDQNPDLTAANKMKSKMVGTWKVTDAKQDLYDRGIFRSKVDVPDMKNIYYEFKSDGTFTQSGNGESTVQKSGTWNLYIVDTEDDDNDAVSEGENYDTYVEFYYKSDNGKPAERVSWNMDMKKKNSSMVSKIETEKGIIHLDLDKQ